MWGRKLALTLLSATHLLQNYTTEGPNTVSGPGSRKLQQQGRVSERTSCIVDTGGLRSSLAIVVVSAHSHTMQQWVAGTCFS